MSVRAEDLGSPVFRRRYGVRLSYVAGSMYRGISSPELVAKMATSGLLSFLGSGGLSASALDHAVAETHSRLGWRGGSFGINLLASPSWPSRENEVVDLCLSQGIDIVETSAFVSVTPPMVRYRLTGLTVGPQGEVVAPRRIMAKVSRPEVARLFLGPPPEPIIRQLLDARRITEDEARLASRVSMADSITVEADSGGHTDQRPALTLLPDIIRLRDKVQTGIPQEHRVSVGAAGGLGTPSSVAAVLLMGADYVLTGSVNQCTVEAGTSDIVKDMLEEMGTADTSIAPAGDMFEEGAKVQVLGKGTLFAPRGRKLYELYQRYSSWDDLVRDDPRAAHQIQEKWLGKSFDEVWQETCARYALHRMDEIERAERQPRTKMGMVFRRYFSQSSQWAQEGEESQRVNFQIQCGPALGAWNGCVRGTRLESWRSRHVDEVAETLMQGAAEHLEIALGRYRPGNMEADSSKSSINESTGGQS
ncbi:PfaD family polyunsaturated fatty acid/polyketide biosynthesis protein [Actinomyces bowdenii]|uniref:PfaD family polyunsaturated fatty acid/polyketide biosynthesis protein n=1 Tax=Actinomyces bowdenii TaxID=131109 RepID=A0A853EHB5_9ACTO|nr:PfaD family polyunsaturated fatty acid/polyketide biosynthesis protein [Actinomyces bowdenii]MBF0695872.1 PfaD family polyunsaturated fatty acid/polyketide biosynthesis protein [Actinomyces bowdenii]MDO5092617.1 PfaD family polyunsaturated fatty acid/polyketide biosynthesis protein [Propionibacteriaceae bacterium]NYS68045.1 PfaD family polyunsaturated fatty acid/polyketide biosynthesis protein [Actinomyces bowdenii]